MADHHPTTAGHSLPPVSSLMQGLIKCRYTECRTLCKSRSECHQHERQCQFAVNPAQHCQSLAHRPVNFPVQPYTVEAAYAFSSYGDADSDGSPVMYTPGNSRAPSIEPTERRRSAVGPYRTVPRRHSRQSSPEGALKSEDSCESKRLKKQEKEQQSREQLKSSMYRVEDFFAIYLGWERHEQSGGNGNGAGLHARKETIAKGEEAVLYHWVHKAYCHSLMTGTLDEFLQENREVLDNAMSKEPYADTFLEARGERLCKDPSPKSKECERHGGHTDWRDCRRGHASVRFTRNKEEWMTEQFSRLSIKEQSRPAPSSRKRFAC